jgi:hypothetical protein
VAGYLGADYYLLRWLGTPWNHKSNKVAGELKPVPAD